MKKLLVFLVILGVFLYAGIRLVDGVIGYLQATVGESISEAQDGSFALDSDDDKLSNGKERIYGTDSQNPDTDGDGFLDGDEVARGFDPTVAGEGIRIRDNPRLMGNLTVEYFLWGQERTGIEDPQLNEEAVVTFFQETGIAALRFPTITDEEITAVPGGEEAVKQYLVDLANIQLPTETASFLDLAQEVLQSRRTEVLGRVTAGLTETYESFRQLKTPPEVQNLQKGYLASIKALQSMFLDLYTVERDPVKLMRNVRWVNELIQKSADLEARHIDLIDQYFPQEEAAQEDEAAE